MSFRHGGIVLGAGEGKTISVLGASYTYKAAKEETRGAYALIEHTVVGDGPPPHIHAAEEEAFYVLEGELNVLIGERIARVTAGAFVLVPRGTVHTFSKAGTASAKVLVIISQRASRSFLRKSQGRLTWTRLWRSRRSITWKSSDQGPNRAMRSVDRSPLRGRGPATKAECLIILAWRGRWGMAEPRLTGRSGPRPPI